jgi:hypothetical protein
MAKSKKTVTRISIDHQPFLETLKTLTKRNGGRVSVNALGVMIAPKEYNTIMEHGKWFRKFVAQRKRASAARTSHGPRRKPDSEVSAGALATRKWRDAKRAG